MQKKDDKVGNNTGYKKERSSARKNKKAASLQIVLVGKYVLVVAKLIFCHSLANWPKTSPKKRNW